MRPSPTACGFADLHVEPLLAGVGRERVFVKVHVFLSASVAPRLQEPFSVHEDADFARSQPQELRCESVDVQLLVGLAGLLYALELLQEALTTTN